VKQRWQQFEQWFNARVLRERILVAVAAVAGILYLGYMLYIGPAWQELTAQRSELASTRQQVRTAEQELQALSPQALEKRAKALKDKRRSVRRKLAERRAELAEGTGQFIQPGDLMAFLERLLSVRAGDNLRVVALESLPREPVPGLEGGDNGPRLLRKGVRTVLEAGFHATRGFLSDLQDLPWAVQVSSLDYRVTEHPLARVELRVHTFLLPEGPGAEGESP
jgi:MSHA biogenesis protein MshJ